MFAVRVLSRGLILFLERMFQIVQYECPLQFRFLSICSNSTCTWCLVVRSCFFISAAYCQIPVCTTRGSTLLNCSAGPKVSVLEKKKKCHVNITPPTFSHFGRSGYTRGVLGSWFPTSNYCMLLTVVLGCVHQLRYGAILVGCCWEKSLVIFHRTMQIISLGQAPRSFSSPEDALCGISFNSFFLVVHVCRHTRPSTLVLV